MVDTIKFSEFVNAGDLVNDETTVGLAAGTNARFNNPWTFLAPGSTDARPDITPEIYYRLRFNTTVLLYEYYNPVLPGWVQLDDENTILMLLASHLPNEGASLIGLEDQSTVIGKTVQDLANATLISQTNNGTLVNGVYLNLLPTGVLSVTTATGDLDSRVLTGTANQIDVANGNASANPTFSLPSTLIAPGTVAVGNILLDTSTIFSTDTDGDLILTPDGTGNLVLDGQNWPQTSGTAGYFLQTDGLGQTSWEDAYNGTVSPGLINELAYYAATGDVVSGLTTAADGVLITSALSVPSISSTLPSAVQANITEVGTVTSGTWNASLIGLAYGGTNANLTANLGGIFYSTATEGAILSGTATANQILQSGASAAPAWSTATYPATTTINNILYSSSDDVISEITAVNSAVLTSSSTGVPAWSSTLTDGDLIIGSTGATPVAASLTAGPGVSIANGAGSITISSTGLGIGWQEVTGASQAMVEDTGYVANNAGLVTFTLPTTAAFGTVLAVIGKGAGGWQINQNAGQNIQVGSTSSMVGVGGSIASTNRYDAITLLCTTADITWTTINGPQGNITVV